MAFRKGMDVLNEVLNMVKALEKKPSPAHLMSLAKQTKTRFLQDRQLEMPDEDPSTWMTSKEYARSQGFDSLVELIRHKIEMDGGEMSDGLEKAVGDL